MKQAISGVSPSAVSETPIMEVWPSICRYPSGRFLGRLYEIKTGGYVLTVGNVLALASIPHALFLYFYRLLPSVMGSPLHGGRYRLTNRRVTEVRSEFHLGPGPRWMRVFAGVKTIVLSLLLFVGVQQFWVGWGWPSGLLQTLVMGLSGVGVLAGLIALLAPVPVPVFTFAALTKSIDLDKFDTIEIEQLPGQKWFQAGDLIFKQGVVEMFRLEGVSRPEAFRQTILKAHRSYVGVKRALQQELAHA
jgi:hypothetical protein